MGKSIYEVIKKFSHEFVFGIQNVEFHYNEGQKVRLLDDSNTTKGLIEKNLIRKVDI